MTEISDYREARAKAQALADSDGFDRGIEYNTFGKYYRIFILPAKRHRFGFEQRCEVVSCSDMSKVQPGDGP